MILKDNFFDKNEHCTFENDKLDRKSLAVNLTNILQHSNTDTQGLILALNAQWGNGKTTFIKMWKNMLDKENKIPNLYFSAWEEDYTKEPLIAVLGELNRYLTENKIQNKNFNQVMESVQKIFKRTLPILPKIIVKALLNKIEIDNESSEELLQALTGDDTKTLIENYSKEKECLVQLKENLTKVFEATGAKEGQPFIIFIDEIDRCRPTYAIEMLENIKHLFGIPNLVFVISIDKEQLSKSIQAIYGQIDTENYLRRFFDLEVTLPNPSPQRFCKYLQEKLKIKTNLTNIFIADNFTLRELQKILPQIRLLEMQQFQDNNKELAFDIKHAIFILLLKIYKPDLYSQIPNITDIKGVMEVFEKLVCKGKEILNQDFFFEYVGIVYKLCDNREFEKDAAFLLSPSNVIPLENPFNEQLDMSDYSYIVQTYHRIMRVSDDTQGLKVNMPTNLDIDKIISAINFTSQFAIQDKSSQHTINPTP